jgi:nitronate monooxygenase
VSFLERLGVSHPVVQAGMGGGIAGASLAGAVSAAGGLGTVGTLPPRVMREEIVRARELAGGAPVGANLLVPFVTRAHVSICTEVQVPVVTLHAGFGRALVERLKAGGAAVAVTVGTVKQAHRALADGADALVVQGREAGGHIFGVEPALEALARVREAAPDVPLLLAGGIADGADTRIALAAGAAAVVAGTRFLLTDECDAHPVYKRRVLDAERTLETRLFGLGWPMRHRVVPNAATERWCRGDPMGPRPVQVLQALSTPMARLPLSLVKNLIRTQHPAVPLFGPAAPVTADPERLVEAAALYAGDTALRIESIVPAREAVELRAGVQRAAHF